MNALHIVAIFCCLLPLFASPEAMSIEKPKGWQFIGEFESGDSQYIDLSTLKKERGYVRVRTMVNYKKPVWALTSKKIYSEAGTDYIDCKSRRFMILEASSYECAMARCTAKESASYPYDEAEFKPISNASSQIGNVFDLVCQ